MWCSLVCGISEGSRCSYGIFCYYGLLLELVVSFAAEGSFAKANCYEDLLLLGMFWRDCATTV